MNTLEWLIDKYSLDIKKPSPIEIPNVGRDTMVGWWNELGFVLGAEVGVERGVFSKFICETNPQACLYSVDPWKGYFLGKREKSDDLMERAYQTAKERLAPYKNNKIIRKTSVEGAKDIPDESLDFVFIDGNHDYTYCLEDITVWSRKLKKGGMISGHDYIRKQASVSDMHVIEAVNDYVKANNISPWFLLGLKAKNNGMIRDASRSWMWIK